MKVKTSTAQIGITSGHACVFSDSCSNRTKNAQKIPSEKVCAVDNANPPVFSDQKTHTHTHTHNLRILEVKQSKCKVTLKDFRCSGALLRVGKHSWGLKTGGFDNP